ncbi:MAG: rhomboid family intramembrane serine protease [Acidobacteriota bacterium]|nr:MAG: rhomboid family intramembrane serine protease [Acidobacteriota bacterium]
MSFQRGPYGGGVNIAFPPVTPMVRQLLWALGIAFAIQVLLEETGFGAIVAWLALRPAYVFPFVWQLVTYALLHGGLTHLLFNMLGLWMFGGDVERLLGSRAFLRYCLVCVVGGALAHVVLGLLVQGPSPAVIGASGGVLGVVLAFALLFPHRQIFLFPLPVPLRARTVAILFAAIDLYGAIRANPIQGGGIAHSAHLGGMLAGYLYLKGFIRPGGWLSGFKRRFGSRRDGFRVIDGDRRDIFHRTRHFASGSETVLTR